MDTVTCPSCGHEWPADGKFCMECGARLTPAPPTCEERKVVTSLFCDLVGFTALSERMDPEDVDRMLRGYSAVAHTVVESFGGVVEKFIGDAVVAVFGVPTVHEDDPERAVRAGLRLVERVAGLPAAGGQPLQVRIGVNTGEALVRLDVQPGSGEGFITGDAVNTAARLQAAAPPCGVLVGDTTYRLSQQAFTYEPVEPLALKGKEQPVLCRLATATVSRLGIDPTMAFQTPLVGRETELLFLTSLYDKCVSSAAPQAALIVGEPGIGKSRLVAELFHHMDEAPVLTTWRQGRCPSYGEAVTFWALGEILKAHAGILESDDAGTAEAKLAKAVPDGPDAAWLTSRLRPLVGLEAPEADREENFAAWLRFLELLAGTRPTVIVVEDLHWADDALLAFLEHVASHLAEVPLFLVMTARPEVFEKSSAFGSHGRINRIALEPLSGAETGRLVAELVETLAVPAGVVDALTERAHGNPFFAEESVRLLRDSIVQEGERLLGRLDEAAAPGGGAPMPGSVHAVIAARLDTLRPIDKAVLSDAAVVGESFWGGSLAAVGERERAEVDEALARLVAKQLLRRRHTSSMEDEIEYMFGHALAREVAYGELPRAQRARKHASAATWLEQKAGERVEEVAEILAHHYSTALDLAVSLGETEVAETLALPAGLHLAAAGERAARLDLDTALRYFERALAVLPPEGRERGDTLRHQARALCVASRPQEGIEAYFEAERCLLAAGARNAAACCTVDKALWMATAGDDRWRGDVARLPEILDPDDPSPDLVHAYHELAGVRAVRLRDYPASLAAANEALAVAEAIGAPAPPGGYEWRSEARAYLGDPGFFDDYELALRLAEEQNASSNAIARLHHNHAHIVASCSGPAAAIAAFEENIEFARRRGMEYWIMGGRCSAVVLRVATGEFDLVQREVDDLETMILEGGWGEGEEVSSVRSLRALLLTYTGRASSPACIDEARRLAAWLPSRADIGVNDALLGATCLVAAAMLHADLGEASAAHELLLRCADEAGVGPWGPCCEGSAEGLLPRAVRLALALDDAALGQRLRDGTRPLTPLDEHGIVTADALLAEARGELEAAAAGFADAAARWREFGVPYEGAQALLGRGRCLVALGRAPEAAPVLEQAREVFARLGAMPALAETDALLAAAGGAPQGGAGGA